MIKKRLVLFVLILLIIPLVYSVGYSEGPYNSDKYGIGRIESAGGGYSGAGGGGSGSAGSALSSTGYECFSGIGCKEDQYCFEFKCYDYECTDDSACEKDESCWNNRCVKLFDIEIVDFESPAKLGEFFDFTYLVKGVADVNDDIEIHFWIEKDTTLITSGHDTIYLKSYEEKTKTTKLFLSDDLVSGTYDFFIQVKYGTYKAQSHRSVELFVGEGGLVLIDSPDLSNFALAAIGFGIFILILILFLERKNIKAELKREEQWVKRHKILFTIFLLILILIGIVYYLFYIKSPFSEQIQSLFNIIIEALKLVGEKIYPLWQKGFEYVKSLTG